MPELALEVASTETVRSLVRRESETRLECVRVASARDAHTAPDNADDLRQLVVQSVEVLEGSYLAACSSEVLERLGIRKFSELVLALPRVVEELRQVMRVDPMLIVYQTNGTKPIRKLGDDDPVGVPLAEMLSNVRSMIASWPIRALEQIAIEHDAEHLGHRARVAHDGLRSFLSRNDPDANKRIIAAGQAYARGHMPLEDVAVLLNLDRPDTIALMQEHGYCRSIEKLRLDDDARSRVFELMKLDRLRRRGQPEYSREYVARDVIASERLEGVDARAWIRTPD